LALCYLLVSDFLTISEIGRRMIVHVQATNAKFKTHHGPAA
jgi:hypothetical protein